MTSPAFSDAGSELLAAASRLIDVAPPLVLAAVGGAIGERAGVVNIGLEGILRFGAFAGAVGAFFSGSPWVGLACGALAGAAAAGVHALLSLRFRADQVVSGLALNLVALGLVTFLLESVFGSSGVSPPVPLLTRDRFGHNGVVYLALAAPLAFQWLLSRTALGLRVRAVGEHPLAAATLGIRVLGLRAVCVVLSGLLGGLGGAFLPLGLVGQFDSRMPAGLGFMALAAVVFGRWSPLGAGAAALFFAAADALQRRVALGMHAADLRLEGLFLALPYALTLLVLCFGARRARAPAASGVPFSPESR